MGKKTCHYHLLHASFLHVSFCVRLSLLLLSRYDTANEYLTLCPGQKCYSKVMHRKEVTHSNGSYERKSRGRKLADEMGRGKKKFPWYTHRQMHRKRVTSELHESCFCSMTINHDIPKIELAIEWALSYYITLSRQKSKGSCSRVGEGDGQGVVEKATAGRRGPREPRWSLGTRDVADKMQ